MYLREYKNALFTFHRLRNEYKTRAELNIYLY